MELSSEKIDQYDNRLKRRNESHGESILFENFVDGHAAIDFVHFCLLKTWDERKVTIWWNTPNTYYDGQRPIDVWSHNPQWVINDAIFQASIH